MAIVTEVRFAHEVGALADTLTALPDLTVSIVRETSTTPEQSVYFFRFDNATPDEIGAALENDCTVRDGTPVSAVDNQHLWGIEFAPETRLLGPEVTREGGVVLDARSSTVDDVAPAWRERWFFPDPAGLQNVWQHARVEGFEFEVLDLSKQLRSTVGRVDADPLTDQQRTALTTAYEQGYFRQPQETSLDGLAASLELSPSAVSGRLKRGLKSLIESLLVVEPSGNDGAAVDEYDDGRAGVLPRRSAEPTDAISTRVYVEHPDLALTDTIRSLSDGEISVISDVGTDPQHDVYFFRITATDFDDVESALAADHTVDDFSVVFEIGGQRTYRIEYSDDAKLITPAITERGGLTLETTSYLNGWMLQLQLEDHDALYDLDEYARAEGIRFDVLELKQHDELDDRFDFGLTDSQAEALIAAYRHGYYDEPRDASLEELASLLDLSRTATSGRLRRGSATLVEKILDDDCQ